LKFPTHYRYATQPKCPPGMTVGRVLLRSYALPERGMPQEYGPLRVTGQLLLLLTFSIRYS